MRKALFLDLDWTLIRTKSGETFPQNPGDWEFMPKMLNALWYDICRSPRPIVIVTNQGGVAAGHHTALEIEAKLLLVKQQLSDFLNGKGSEVHPQPCEVYHYCAFAYDYYRKPWPGMAYRAACDLELDLKQSHMIGDMDSDEQFAKQVGMSYQHIDSYLGNHAYTAPTRVREG